MGESTGVELHPRSGRPIFVNPGPTGPIERWDFEKLVRFDEVIEFRVVSPYNHWDRRKYEFMSYHYFLNGFETGYWGCVTGLGNVLLPHRRWCPDLKQLMIDREREESYRYRFNREGSVETV